MKAQVVHGDCRDALAGMAEASVSAIVTDPPYGLEFMGAGWDRGVPGVQFWGEALRVAKPGAHLLAFGGTRTFHRLACAIEDAGWEIRDCLLWIHGQGFPKSLAIDKAIDKAAGAERTREPRYAFGGKLSDDNGSTYGTALSAEPVTAGAASWRGFGTALKPAWEPIILARKPLVGTVAENCQAHGTGALDIDGCRIAAQDGYQENAVTQGLNTARTSYGPRRERRTFKPSNSGRWPANLALDEEAAAMLDEQSGDDRDGVAGSRSGVASSSGFLGGLREAGPWGGFGGGGGASRFFYCAKASSADRGCGGAVDNRHPTVKPLELMRWLVRLVRGQGDGLLLDPFAGSGTTLLAAEIEGVRAVGIEQDAEYVALAQARLDALRKDRGQTLFEGALDGQAPSWMSARDDRTGGAA